MVFCYTFNECCYSQWLIQTTLNMFFFLILTWKIATSQNVYSTRKSVLTGSSCPRSFLLPVTLFFVLFHFWMKIQVFELSTFLYKECVLSVSHGPSPPWHNICSQPFLSSCRNTIGLSIHLLSVAVVLPHDWFFWAHKWKQRLGLCQKHAQSCEKWNQIVCLFLRVKTCWVSKGMQIISVSSCGLKTTTTCWLW